MDFIRKYGKSPIVFWAVILILIFSYFHWYLPWKHFKEGWVEAISWDCPSDHPIKANLRSMIYHLPGDPYYRRTNAMNGECFDSEDHAVRQGFRHIFR